MITLYYEIKRSNGNMIIGWEKCSYRAAGESNSVESMCVQKALYDGCAHKNMLPDVGEMLYSTRISHRMEFKVGTSSGVEVKRSHSSTVSSLLTHSSVYLENGLPKRWFHINVLQLVRQLSLRRKSAILANSCSFETLFKSSSICRFVK